MLPSTGGAIDLIAVKQRDGSLKCSPFYVRFGKYQGLIRGREKVVTVTVNGVLMDFTMRLGRSGEAFFVVYDPDNPGGWADGERVRVGRGESDDDEPETGAASVGTDPAARAEPGSRSSEVQTRRRRTRTSDRRRPCDAASAWPPTEATGPRRDPASRGRRRRGRRRRRPGGDAGRPQAPRRGPGHAEADPRRAQGGRQRARGGGATNGSASQEAQPRPEDVVRDESIDRRSSAGETQAPEPRIVPGEG